MGLGSDMQLVPSILDRFKLEMEQPLFKVAMLNNAKAAMELPPLAPLQVLWLILSLRFGGYLMLIQL